MVQEESRKRVKQNYNDDSFSFLAELRLVKIDTATSRRSRNTRKVADKRKEGLTFSRCQDSHSRIDLKALRAIVFEFGVNSE